MTQTHWERPPRFASQTTFRARGVTKRERRFSQNTSFALRLYQLWLGHYFNDDFVKLVDDFIIVCLFETRVLHLSVALTIKVVLLYSHKLYDSELAFSPFNCSDCETRKESSYSSRSLVNHFYWRQSMLIGMTACNPFACSAVFDSDSVFPLNNVMATSYRNPPFYLWFAPNQSIIRLTTMIYA